MKRICVYSGSNPGNHPEYEQAAQLLGRSMVSHGYELVYGGSRTGLMGALADQVLTLGGRVTGVMPRNLFKREIAHEGLSEFHEVNNMHERKAFMAELADAFISLPGGLGTYEELFEMLCWSQIGIHKKPIALLNTRGFYQPLMDMLHHTVSEGFMKEQSLQLFIAEADPALLLERISGRFASS